MLINIYGAKCVGIDAVPVTVEVDITNGVGIYLVGLADVAVKESLLRTTTALLSMGYRIPGKKIVINLAPADMHKKGSGYDVPIAIGVIAASGQVEMPILNECLIMGELGLDGAVRPVAGALPIVELAAKAGFKYCILPRESAMESMDFEGVEVYGVDTLADVIRILERREECGGLRVRAGRGAWCGGRAEEAAGGGAKRGGESSSAEGYGGGGRSEAAAGCSGEGGAEWNSARGEDGARVSEWRPPHPEAMDFCDIVGQDGAKRGMEIAAGGGHNALLVGPPGAGKSSLALATANILPPLSPEEAIQTSKIYSVAGKGFKDAYGRIPRPFRNPHYSASSAALLGGGSDNIMPGEASLAHNGVLFMDEFCEIPKRIIDTLRSPMEERKVTISRLKTKIEYPADFMLVAATNPCPCGYYGEGDRCTCTPSRRAAYLAKLSGPIMDRIDLHLWMKPVRAADILRKGRRDPAGNSAELAAEASRTSSSDAKQAATPKQVPDTSEEVAARVRRAREIQRKRFAGEKTFTNAAMNSRQVEKYCQLSDDCERYLERLIDKAGLSARACHKILKIARTIADLEAAPDIEFRHLAEAVSYRFLDKQDIF